MTTNNDNQDLLREYRAAGTPMDRMFALNQGGLTERIERLAQLSDLEAESRSRLQAMRLERVAREAGQRACTASQEDADSATARCPGCGYRFTPAGGDFYEIGPLSRRADGDGPRDTAIDCPACGRMIHESDLEDIS